MRSITKVIKLGLVVAGSLFVMASGAVAEELPNRGPIEFSTYDVNKDGFVSEKEFNDIREKRVEQKAISGMSMKNAGNADFSAFDTNKDGKLTETELLKAQNNQMQNNQKNIGMSKGMGQQANMPTFENFDLNNDGMISPKEMEEAKQKRMQEKASEGKMMKNIGNQPTFSDIDTNKDGNINKEEFQTHLANCKQ